ncbi:MAG: hypothetical protein LUF25_02475 [Phascolarctobacterium sp.]|nr:hypothetical protein [Phascolarctobacterium sp.]
MLEATDTVNAPWHLIVADYLNSAQVDIFTSIIDVIDKALQEKPLAEMPVRSI